LHTSVGSSPSIMLARLPHRSYRSTFFVGCHRRGCVVDSLSPFWVSLLLVAVLLLLLMEGRVKLPKGLTRSLGRLTSFEVPIPKALERHRKTGERLVMWLIVLAILWWLLADLNETLRHHYFCERHPEALTCPQEGDYESPP